MSQHQKFLLLIALGLWIPILFALLAGCSTIPDSAIPCLDIKVQVCPVKTDRQSL